jgi:hypothetical protein
MRNVRALAHQRRGEFHLREGNHEDALRDINNAIRLYADWGAKAKVEQLKEKHTELLGPSSEIESTFVSTIPQSPMIDIQSSGNLSQGSSRRVQFK